MTPLLVCNDAIFVNKRRYTEFTIHDICDYN